MVESDSQKHAHFAYGQHGAYCSNPKGNISDDIVSIDPSGIVLHESDEIECGEANHIEVGDGIPSLAEPGWPHVLGRMT